MTEAGTKHCHHLTLMILEQQSQLNKIEILHTMSSIDNPATISITKTLPLTSLNSLAQPK